MRFKRILRNPPQRMRGTKQASYFGQLPFSRHDAVISVSIAHQSRPVICRYKYDI